MKLILMRHAKSDWSGGQTDHQRTLNTRGRRTAPLVGETLAARGWGPQAVWCSDSARTRETWEMMAEHHRGATVHFESRLYLSDSKAIFECVAGIGAEVGVALILAHNPGISEAVMTACGAAIDLRTADAAMLEQPGDDWSAATAGAWRLVEVIRGRAVAP